MVKNPTKVGNRTTDTHFYSSIVKYKFRSKPDVRRYLDCLARVVQRRVHHNVGMRINGEDERAAIVEFRRDKDVAAVKRRSSSDEDDDVDDIPLNLLQQQNQRKRRGAVE